MACVADAPSTEPPWSISGLPAFFCAPGAVPAFMDRNATGLASAPSSSTSASIAEIVVIRAAFVPSLRFTRRERTTRRLRRRTPLLEYRPHAPDRGEMPRPLQRAWELVVVSVRTLREEPGLLVLPVTA